jgi:alpha-tubulin suppressor-like RCC1 family protein
VCLSTDKTVKCWGWNRFGQLGDGANKDRAVPTTVTGLTGVTAITAGLQSTCAVLTDGTVKCWGANSSGELGTNDNVDRSAPTSVNGLDLAS